MKRFQEPLIPPTSGLWNGLGLPNGGLQDRLKPPRVWARWHLAWRLKQRALSLRISILSLLERGPRTGFSRVRPVYCSPDSAFGDVPLLTFWRPVPASFLLSASPINTSEQEPPAACSWSAVSSIQSLLTGLIVRPASFSGMGPVRLSLGFRIGRDY